MEPGEIVAGKYRVERVLGRGGMGLVVEANHIQLDQAVAIKFLLPDAAQIQGASARFLREARAASRIKSEHVARVLDIDTTPEGSPFLVMELLVGIDLHQYIRTRGPMSIADAVDAILQVCEALAEAHALGIVHRDLKPSNLFLTRRLDGTSLVKLLDFGIAKAPETQGWSEGHLTATRGTLGSPMYMSPEQLRDTSSVDHRTDIWALGVILYELLTGHLPFESFGKHFDNAPEALVQVIAKCLDRDPSERHDTVGDLAEALRPFAADKSRVSLERIASVSVVSSQKTVAAVPKPSYRPPAITAPISKPQPSAPQSSVRSVTSNFRRQHEELANLGAELFQQLALPPDEIATRAHELRRSIARFAGKLNMHASMENEALYPRLFEHRDARVREKANDLFEEVKGIYSAFAVYAKRWPTTESIQKEPLAFAKETKRMLKTLWMRMSRENEELYPLVDAAG
jgi:serine/threonine protein kinase